MSEIKNYNKYNSDMQRAMVDKLFFTSTVAADALVDFGCADGALLASYHRLFPSHLLFGYDKDPNMIARAEESCRERDQKNTYFSDSWRTVIDHVNKTGRSSCLLLSSVLHEIYSYCHEDEQDWFESEVLNDNSFKYVVIRDMMVSSHVNRPADALDVARVRQVLGPERITEWESVWGSIQDQRSLLHLLLSYRYSFGENWDRELRENYLPYDLESFITRLPAGYEIIHFEHYALPYLRQTVRGEIGVEIKDNTHVKMILKRL